MVPGKSRNEKKLSKKKVPRDSQKTLKNQKKYQK